MTIDQLNKLSDEEVRVRVALALGWRFADKPFRGARQWLSPDGKWLLKPWDYPADLNAAFTLVEKLRGEWDCEIFSMPLGAIWKVVFSRLNRAGKLEEFAHEHPSLARAICFAFLAVREEGLPL